jgi:sugar lactone lactonase YvrE
MRSPTVYSEWDGLPDRQVYRIAVASDGTVWAAGSTWIARFDGTLWTMIDENVLPDLPHPIGDVAAGSDGTVWVAAGGDALIRVDAGTAETYVVPEPWTGAQPWSMSLAVDTTGTVWASSLVSGMLTFDGEWQALEVDDGLPSYVLGDIVVAPDGALWIGGDGDYGEPGGDIPAAGIGRFDGTDWTTFTTADGLLSNGGEVAIGVSGDVWVIHTSLPEEVAESLGVYLPSGLSRYDGSRWQAYPDTTVGTSRGAVVTAAGTLWMASMEGILGFDGTDTLRLVTGAEAVPPPGPPGDAVEFGQVEDLESIRLSTSIGEIEFTTYGIPAEWGQLWFLEETADGVVGSTYPGGTRVASLDGRIWSEALARILDDVSNPTDIPEVGQATDPPQPSLHTMSGAGCSAPGWVSEGARPGLGPVVAIEGGFVALASSDVDPLCEPWVWVSPDGDGWTLTSEESPFGEGAFIHDMAAVGNTIVAIGGVSRTEGAVWVSEDSVVWERVSVEAAELWHIAGGARGWILTGHRPPDGEIGEMWFSPDGHTWDGPYERPQGWGDRAGLVSSVAMLDDRIVGSGKHFNNTGQAMDSTPARVVVGVFIDE